MLVLVLGGGDLGSGVALRLRRLGLQVVMTELPQPLALRRTVSFSEAVIAGEVTVEGVTAESVKDLTDKLSILQVIARGHIPVLIDPDVQSIHTLHPAVIVDARMTKISAPLIGSPGMLVIGLGPGFEAGVNCHAVIETSRGHTLGRVYWKGGPEPDTGIPEPVGEVQGERVLRSPADGRIETYVVIGEVAKRGRPIAEVEGEIIIAPFNGLVRGLLPHGTLVREGMKIGDIDPRLDPRLTTLVSDKALAVGGGVLEAILLSRPNQLRKLWE